MDTRELRNCFGHFATGVTVVTYKDNQGDRRGITLNSFTSVSMDPPLVLISIDKGTKAYHELRNNNFIINILSDEQQALALQFAGKPQDGLVVDWELDSEVGPKLANTVATIECTPYAEYEGGDHLLFLGRVEDFMYRENDSLLFHKGKFITTNNGTVVNS